MGILERYNEKCKQKSGGLIHTMTKEEIALNIACDLMIGASLYGYDYDRIFEEIMERDGYVSSINIKDYILEHLEELGKEYFVKEGDEK